MQPLIAIFTVLTDYKQRKTCPFLDRFYLVMHFLVT